MAISKEKTPGIVLDTAAVAAVQAQLKKAEKDEAIRAHGGAIEPYKVRYFGSATTITVASVLRGKRTDLSEGESTPDPTSDAVIARGTVVEIYRGDRRLDVIYPEKWERIPDDEAASLSVQDALRFEAVDRVVRNDEGVVESAERLIADRTAAVAAATRARESAEEIREDAVRRLDVSRARMQDHLAPLGGGEAEKALRVILASMVPAPKPVERARAFINDGSGPRELAVTP